MTDNFKKPPETSAAASNGASQNQFPSSLGVSQDPTAAPFSASGASALQAMMTDYLSHCNASSSVPTSQMTTQLPLSNHNEVRNLQIDPRSSSFYQGQSVDDGTALHQSIQKLQSELQEIKGRIQQQPNLSDEVKVKASQKVKESAKHTPRMIVAPCPARGMPFDHNYKTANFTISEDETRHGDELVCSYFNCRKVGIKFLYCGFCKLPVPKRNFCKYHSHPESEEIMKEEKPAKKQETPALESKCPSPQETALYTEMAREPDGPVNKKSQRSKTAQKTQDTSKKSKSLKIRKEVKPAKKQETPPLESKYLSLEESPHRTAMSREADGPLNKKRNLSKKTRKTQNNRKKSSKSLNNEKEVKPAPKQEIPSQESKYPTLEEGPFCSEMARDPDGPVNKKHKRSKTTQKTQDTSKKSKSLKIKKHSPTDSDFDDKNDRLWVELLHERPSANNRKKMSIWLSQVLRVSEACAKSHEDKVSLVKHYADSD